MADQLVPPAHFHPLWLVLGIACLLAVVAGFGWVFWSTRRRRPARLSPPPRPTHRDLAALRRRYLHAIDAVEQAARSGSTTSRAAHIELSMLVRRFLGELRIEHATAMTADELADVADADVASVVRSYHPSEFAPAGASDIGVAAAAARSVVSAWA